MEERKAGRQENTGNRLRDLRTERSNERLQKLVMKKIAREKYRLDTKQNQLAEDPTSKPNREL